DIGAYGDDGIDRASLVSLAKQRAGMKSGLIFTRHDTVVIGDTIHDVSAALQGGAVPVAVATGRHHIDQLEHAGATVALDDLTEPSQLVDAVFKAAERAARPKLFSALVGQPYFLVDLRALPGWAS